MYFDACDFIWRYERRSWEVFGLDDVSANDLQHETTGPHLIEEKKQIFIQKIDWNPI